ncbi:MAG: alanine racemase [Chitinophagales bacterium]
MFSSSIISIDKDALAHNLKFIRSLIDKNVRFSSVVKGNAYGHGLEAFVALALENDVNHFSVYNADEAYRVKMITQDMADVMIMGYMSDEALYWAIEEGVSFYIFSIERLNKTLEIAKMLNKKALIHLEVETGMNRTGLEVHEFDIALDILKKQKEYLYFQGLCTHFAGAENIANFVRITEQKRCFYEFKSIAESAGLKPEFHHTCCSAAAVRFPEMHLDLVRIGIMQFGLWPSKEIFIEYLKDKKFKESPLKRLLSWKSTIMSFKKVDMGEYVGYGSSYLALKDMTIAIVPIGYAHGFTRSLSNQGRALVGGQRVPVIGMVNMNCLALNVNDLENLKVGDEVVLIGEQGNQTISIASFSEISAQVNYELLTRLPSDIPRILE